MNLSRLLILFTLILGHPLLSANAQPTAKRVVVFGDSITAGYGIDPEQAFPALLQKKADQASLNLKFINAGLSGETSAGGLRRINWILKQPVDIFILELGGNDGLRGLALSQTRENLAKIILAVRGKSPQAKIFLAGMEIPPNLGLDYAKTFREIYPAIAAEQRVTLIPFVMEGVGGEVTLNQPDGIHPTAEGHQIIAEKIWSALQGAVSR